MKTRKLKVTVDDGSTGNSSSTDDGSFTSITDDLWQEEDVIMNDVPSETTGLCGSEPHRVTPTKNFECEQPQEVDSVRYNADYCMKDNESTNEISLDVSHEAEHSIPAIDGEQGEQNIPDVSCEQNESRFPSNSDENAASILSTDTMDIDAPSSDIDFDKLCKLLESAKNAGDCIEGKDVIVLIGTTGSGKTTSLLYLSGVQFEEVDDEYKPTSYPTEQLKEFEISDSAESCTRQIQAFDLVTNGLTVAICDTPGFEDTYGIENDIANGIGLVTAIHRAKSAIPVIVLSSRCTESRYQPLKDTLKTVHRMTGGEMNIDFSTFYFLFTNCTEKEYRGLKRKIEKLNDEIQSNDNHPMRELRTLTESMVSHFTTHSLRIDLSEANQEFILSCLMKNKNTRDHKTSFQDFVSDKASESLEKSLLSILLNVERDLRDQNYDPALKSIEQLIRFTNSIDRCGKTFLPRSFEFDKVTRRMLGQCNVSAERFCRLPIGADVIQQEAWTLKKEISILDKISILAANQVLTQSAVKSLFVNIESSIRVNDESLMGMTLQMTAWRLKQLQLCATTFEGTEIASFLATSYTRSFDQTNYVVEQKLLQMKADASKSFINIANHHDSLVELIDFVTALERYGVVNINVDKSSLKQLLDTVICDLKSDLVQRQNDLANAQREFEIWLDAKDEKRFSAARSIRLGKTRDTIIKVAGSPKTFEKLFGEKRILLEQGISCFDKNFALLIERMLCIIETKWTQITDDHHADLASSHKNAKYMAFKLNEIKTACENARSWCDFDSKRIDQSWEETVRLQENVKNFIDEVNDEMKEFVRECGEALNSATSILHRLKVAKESPSDLLQEVCESQNWKKWSTFISEGPAKLGIVKGSFRRFTTFLGFSGKNGGKLDDLKAVMTGIVQCFQQKVQMAVGRFVSLISKGKLSLAIAKAILSNVEKLTFLLNLLQLPKDSDLRGQIINSQNRSELGKLIPRLSGCVKQLAALHISYCEKKEFNELFDLMSCWKTSQESWMQLSSISCIPVASQETFLDRSLTYLQENILSCPTIDDVVKDCFKAISLLRDDVQRISFSPVDDVATPHKRLVYFDRIARLSSESCGIHRFKEFATTENQQMLLDIDSCFLSKISEELTQVNKQLMTWMSSFPSDRSNFKRIHEYLSNLSCVETAFKSSHPSIARLASDYLAKMDDHSKELLSKDCQMTVSEGSIVKGKLLLWKKVCYEIPRWRSFVNTNISDYLKRSKKNASCRTSFLFDLANQLKSVEGEDKILAQQLLSEHSIFEGLMNETFNVATERQDINYVLGNLRSLSQSEKEILQVLYADYKSEYERVIQDGFRQISNGQNMSSEAFYSQLVSETKDLAKIKSVSYSKQLSLLTAKIFAYWSLTSNKEFFESDGASGRKFLKSPHSAQVIAVWLLLNAIHEEHVKMENAFVELKTGEGKSIVLGVTATILALFGFQVDCVCYSEYLSSRDRKDFRDIFCRFDVMNAIQYGNIETFTIKMMENYWSQAKLLVLGKNTATLDGLHGKSRRILLVDEVDVFFGENVFGKQYWMAGTFSDSRIKGLFHQIWNSSSVGFNTSEITEKYPIESHRLLNNELSKYWAAAQQVKAESSDEYIVNRGRIMQKHFDGLFEYVGALECFRYMKEFELGNLSKEQLENNLHLTLDIGRVSYAELSYEYTNVLGLTGTLCGIGDMERKILKEKYNIHKYFYLPSVYGENRLKFAADTEQDVMICESKAGFFLDLKTEIERRRNGSVSRGNVQRAVLVFFHDKKEMLEFYDSSFMKALKDDSQVITEEASREEREGLFSKATEKGAITLMTRDFGRGTDFKCFDQDVKKAGGVHVIQAFFSIDPSEEIQIKGRCARQGDDGSFSMVLNAEDLTSDFGLSIDAIKAMKTKREIYKNLDEIRNRKCQTKVSGCLNAAKSAEEYHYWTLECLDLMRQGRKDLVFAFFEELNGVKPRQSFASLMHPKQYGSIKQARIEENAKLLRDFVAEDKRCRMQAHERLMLEASVNDKTKKRVRECIATQDSTYYSILGVTNDAPTDEIIKSFRELSKIFHPDKCSDSDATGIFQKLNEAKEILCCESKRSAHDAELLRKTSN